MRKRTSRIAYMFAGLCLLFITVTLAGCSLNNNSLNCNHSAQDLSGITVTSDTAVATQTAIQSAVSVYTVFNKEVTVYNPRPTTVTQDVTAAGAGVIYKIQGDDIYIITNYHMVYDQESTATDKLAHTYYVYLYGHEENQDALDASLVGGSMDKDIAILKVTFEDVPDCIVAASISNKIILGERVIAIGNPMSQGIAVTSGVVSVISETITMEALNSTNFAKRYVDLTVIRTDAAINGGNSGGGLFNIEGKLVGIVVAKTIENGIEGMGYVIPVNVAIGEAVRLGIGG